MSAPAPAPVPAAVPAAAPNLDPHRSGPAATSLARLGSPLALLRAIPHRAKVVLALGAVYVIWGSTFLANGVAVASIPPFLMLATRFLVAGALLYVVATLQARRKAGYRAPTLRQWWHATLTGCLLLVGGTGLVTAAQVHLGSGMAALLCSTVPLWLALIARVRFGDQLRPRSWLGLAVGLAGVGTLVDPSGGKLVPMLVVLLGAMSWAFGSLRSRTADAHTAPLVASAMEMLGAGAGFLVVGLALGEPGRLDLAAIDRGSILALVYLVTAGSIVAFTAYRWLLNNVATVLVGSHGYVNPVVAVGLGWAFAGELVTSRTLVGGAIVLCAVVLMVTSRPEQPVPAQATSGGDVFAGQRRWRLGTVHLDRRALRPQALRVQATRVRAAGEEAALTRTP